MSDFVNIEINRGGKGGQGRRLSELGFSASNRGFSGGGGGKGRRLSSVFAFSETVEQLDLPSQAVGAIIGAKGSVIQSLRKAVPGLDGIEIKNAGEKIRIVYDAHGSRQFQVDTHYQSSQDSQTILVGGKSDAVTETIASVREILKAWVDKNASSHTAQEPKQQGVPAGDSVNATNIFTEFAAFMSELTRRKTKPELKAHSPGCNCKKAEHAHRSVAASAAAEDTGLVVLPNTKRPQVCFVCPGTSFPAWVSSHTACEETLARHIFSRGSIGEENSAAEESERSSPQPRWKLKISCASCMLEMIPNAAVFISGPPLAVEGVLTTARKAADLKASTSEGLHHDHAHVLVALPLEKLQSVAKKRSTRSAIDTLVTAMARAGLVKKTEPPKMEHHLVTALQSDFFKAFSRRNGVEEQSSCAAQKETTTAGNHRTAVVVVLVYDDEKKWTLDLPGGKRHLGEDAWTCARRETFEETSIRIEEAGILASNVIRPGHQVTSGSTVLFERREEVLNDSMCYYLLEPPIDAAVELEAFPDPQLNELTKRLEKSTLKS